MSESYVSKLKSSSDLKKFSILILLNNECKLNHYVMFVIFINL